MDTRNQLVRNLLLSTALSTSLLGAFRAAQGGPSQLGLFQDATGVGTLLHSGSAEYSPGTQTYMVTGSGENMWSTADAFEFVWTRMEAASVTLTADISPLAGGEEHRKAALMIRQSLDADSAYADVALHGNGLTSLQFREAKGAPTHEIESNVSAPHRLRIEKRGDRFYMFLSDAAGHLSFAGGSTRVPMTAPFYVGLAVCAHNKDAIFKAGFSNVALTSSNTAGKQEGSFHTIETINVSSTDALVSYVSREPVAAAAWSADVADLVFRAGKAVMRAPAAGGSPREASLEDAALLGSPGEAKANRWVSPDGRMIALLLRGPEAMAGGVAEVRLAVAPMPDKIPVSAQPGAPDAGLAPRTIAIFDGDERSLGPRPWSPDSRRIVFISHQTL